MFAELVESLQSPPVLTLLSIFLALTVLSIVFLLLFRESRFCGYAKYITYLFFVMLISETVSFYLACWLWIVLSFLALREYFSLVDIRLQDRFAILIAYTSVPFMMHLIYYNLYNIFIISIPVYYFLLIPLLVALGGKISEGAISSIGIICLGMFLFVFCLGHLVYMSNFSIWMTGTIVIGVSVCDVISFIAFRSRMAEWIKIVIIYVVSIPFTVAVSIGFSGWSGIPMPHSAILGALLPAIVIGARYVIRYVSKDLGVIEEDLRPGRGAIITYLGSLVFAGPIFLHYIRYFVR